MKLNCEFVSVDVVARTIASLFENYVNVFTGNRIQNIQLVYMMRFSWFFFHSISSISFFHFFRSFSTILHFNYDHCSCHCKNCTCNMKPSLTIWLHLWYFLFGKWVGKRSNSWWLEKCIRICWKSKKKNEIFNICVRCALVRAYIETIWMYTIMQQ